MSESNPVTSSLERFGKAWESLEQVIDLRLEKESLIGDAEAEVQRMGADRVRLAESLDRAEERAQVLERANTEVSRRLVDAMESIRGIVERKPQDQ